MHIVNTIPVTPKVDNVTHAVRAHLVIEGTTFENLL